MSNKPIIVIGTGASASVIARHYAAKGQRVLMLERGDGKPYAPRTDLERWREGTSEGYRDGTHLSENRWDGLDEARARDATGTLFDDLTAAENLGDEFQFRYNMRLGYGGSSAVWSGRTWRFPDEDFATKSNFGYGLDWPVTAEEMAPHYSAAEELMGVSGPDDADWPFDGNYQSEAFAQTHSDKMISRLFGKEYAFFATSNAVPNKDPRQGGCVAAKTCVHFCPTNALFRHYQMLDPLIEAGKVEVRADHIVTGISVDADGFADGVHYTSRSGKTGIVKVDRDQKLFVAANTIETLRILLNSERTLGNKVANANGMLGKYFGSHGAVVREITSVHPLKPGRSRPSTSAGLVRDPTIGRDRFNAHMLELWNGNHFRGSAHISFERFRQETGLWGRELFEAAQVLDRQAPASIIFEIELRERNKVDLSNYVDSWGVPLARVDFELGERDLATLDHVTKIFDRAGEHKECEVMGDRGRGLNGNHPIGGYVMGTSPGNSTTDASGRAWGHGNLYLTGGGLFGSTSAFNPTLTITANTLRSLERIDQGEAA